MNGNDNISGNYRKLVEELLGNKSDLISFNPLNQDELDKIWEEISIEMDMDEVWDDISTDLEIVMPEDSGSGIFLRSIAAVIIILFGLIPAKKMTLDTGISRTDILTNNIKSEQSANQRASDKQMSATEGEREKGNISPALRSILDNNNDVNKPTQTEKIENSLEQITPVPVSKETNSRALAASEIVDFNPAVHPDRTTVEKARISTLLISAEPEYMKMISRIASASMKTNDNSSTFGRSLPITERGRFSGGIITMYRNTWLVNYETLDGFKSKSLNTTKVVFFPDVGLSLNYSLNKKWWLQADGFFYSSTGQEYLDYLNGNYSRIKITLRYSTIDLSVKYKFTGRDPNIRRTSINLITGGYLSVLHRADRKINRVFENTSSQFENVGSLYGKLDLGLIFGSEIELPLSDRLSLAPGLFLSLGIPNIYKGNNYIAADLRRTHNGTAGFHLTLYYHFD